MKSSTRTLPGTCRYLSLGLLSCLAVLAGAIPVIANTVTYNFNDGTLQGWNNRVWDLAANGGAGGWVNLAPNVSTMPGTINGGALQPPSGDNGMFAPGSSAVWINGNNDAHLNTLWLRSPEFYLDGSGDLTVQMAKGTAVTADPVDEAAVSHVAATDGGWKGVVLRRVSDGAFLLSKPRTGTNNDEFRTVTFNAFELEAYIGERCTLELINSSRGGWGWLVMDNVSIPGTDVEPVAPSGLAVANGATRVVVSWAATPKATAYKVWRSTTSGSGYVLRGTTTDLQFTDTGLTPGTPYHYVVSATNAGGESVQSAQVTGNPAGGSPSSAKDLLSFGFGPFGNATITGTTVDKYLPAGTNVTALAPSLSTSLFATSNPGFGVPRDFTLPQTYTITAENGTTKVYTVNVFLVSNLTYDFTGGLQGWTQLWPSSGSAWENNALGSGHDAGETRFVRSPEFYLVGSGPLTFSLDGGQSELAAPHVGPPAIPELAIAEGGFAGVALRDVVADTYVLSKRKSGDGGGYAPYQFTAAELQPFANDGKQYTLDYIDYNKGGWGWTYLDNVSIPGVSQQPGTEAVITSVAVPPLSLSDISGTDITVTVPAGTNITALALGIAASPQANISPPATTPRDFTTPQTYTVTSGDMLVTNVYTVTVNVGGLLTVKTYDEVSGAAFLNPIANLQAETPSGTAPQLGDIFYGDFAAQLPGLTGNDSFSLLWEGWLDVAKEGHGAYTFGSQSDDGSVVYLDLNNDGDFDDAGELVLNNNGDHGYDIKVAEVYLGMDSVRYAIAYYEAGGGEGLDVRFKKGSGLDFASLDRVGGTSGHFLTDEPAADPSSANLWYLTLGDDVAKEEGTQIRLGVPFGTDVTALDPVFNLSPGATSTPPSGTVRDFSSPQTYSVKSANNATTRVFTVTVYQRLEYDFSTASLQGWHNRVWDLSANGGSGGWIDLAPDATSMPSTVNGGALQPPSGDNGLFAPVGGRVEVNGNTDNHLNTLWLRSPEFHLAATGDLTVSMAKGIAHTADPANEAAVPHAASTGGGWKGVILRRASDGAFLLAKPRTGADGDEYRAVTFTAAELAPYDGVACTLELINSDRGNWGWLTMDDVAIPTYGLVPVAPFDAWQATFPGLVGAAGGADGDADRDGSSNLVEYAFGTDPESGASGPITHSAGTVTGNGQPLLDTSSGFAIVFGRRLDRVEAGLTYTVQFSKDLSEWVDSATTPQPLAANPEIEAVRVPYPATIATTGGPQVPQFVRVRVTMD